MPAIHITSAILALVLGAVVLARRKGGMVHRSIGFGYVTSMLTLNLSALTIYHLTGRVGPFHVLAVVSLFGVIAGVVMIERRGPGWMERHALWMMWSYAGLLAATASEIAARLPYVRKTHGPIFAIAIAGSSTAVLLLAYPLIERKRRAMRSA